METGDDNFLTVMLATEPDQIFLEVRITYPLLSTSGDGVEFHKYGIALETNDPAFSYPHSLIWRRYSDFRWLRKWLLDGCYCSTRVPELPSKGLFQDRSHPAFLENRRQGLEHFVISLLKVPLYKADRGVHLFLQSDLSVPAILDVVHGTSTCKEVMPALDDGNSGTNVSSSLMCPSYSGSNTFEEEKASNKNANSNSLSPSCSSASPSKKVTFCKHVQVVLLENASPTNKTIH